MPVFAGFMPDIAAKRTVKNADAGKNNVKRRISFVELLKGVILRGQTSLCDKN